MMAYKPLIDTESLQDKFRRLEKENLALKLKHKDIKARLIAFRKNYKAMMYHAEKIVFPVSRQWLGSLPRLPT